ncbi:hypothetical protein ACWDTP_08855 [Mycobacterium sp. NPDC003449]
MDDEQVSTCQWRLTLTLVVIAVALALSALVIEFPDRHMWATTLQLVSALIAVAGFAYAYVRARYDRSLGGQIIVWGKQFGAELWRQLRRKPKINVLQPGPAQVTYGGGTPRVTATDNFVLNPNGPVDEVATSSEQAAEGAIRHIQDEIAALSAQLDSQQVLDLRWAIGGLLITVVGIALSH